MPMGGPWQNDVRELLRALEAAQRDLTALYERKRGALVEGASEELLSVARDEAALANRFHGLLSRREQILQAAEHSGRPKAETLLALVGSLSAADRGELEPLISEARQRSEILRRETWVQWIIAHRAHSHYSGMLELIAHSGGKPPTYDAKPGKETTGGALFDASA
jgi:hypothetical protein